MNLIRKIFFIIAVLAFHSCEDALDLRPMDKLDAEALFGSQEGVQVFMANLYSQLPIEDFAFTRNGFNTANINTIGITPSNQTDIAANSEYSHLIDGGGNFPWWGYGLNRDVNLLIETIPTLSFSEEEKQVLMSEAHFIRAFTYFALAKRYGGVPIITTTQSYEGDIESLKVPRSTEKETWDFVLEECDRAIEHLPPGGGGERRATKWAAYALKSRAALHAASVAKYWDKAPLSGPAVDQNLVGMNPSEANRYYEECIKASEAIMNSGTFSLYMPTPGSPQEAAENYRQMFEDPNNALQEAIFIKGYTEPSSGHSFDFWFNPNQTSDGAPHPGRMNPTLELVDTYESYSNPGESAPIITTLDGEVNDYSGYDRNEQYIRFDTPYEIFEDKDARLWATVVLPGTEWKGETIVIQAGYIEPDGTGVIETNTSTTLNGVTYYTFGAADWTNYSGFSGIQAANMSRSGFSFKKFLSTTPVNPNLGQSRNDWMEFRYAEILLNYAEAVVESGYTADNAEMRATEAINDIRRRAAHTVEIPLTLENVLRERKVELAFENKRYWDLIRRRDFHLIFDNYQRHGLKPLLDLRVDPPQYIFVRTELPREHPLTFPQHFYYVHIPGIGSNDLVQNPQY
jgi:hypothetical protein